MKYLQILNYALLAFGAAMTMVMAVVTLIMALYREEAAEIGGDFNGVVASTIAFAAFTATAAVACWSLRHGHRLMWAAQGGLLLVLVGVFWFLPRLV